MLNIELRDYFAGQALSDIMDLHRDDLADEIEQVRARAARRIAGEAYAIADAMLQHRTSTTRQPSTKGGSSKARKAKKKA